MATTAFDATAVRDFEGDGDDFRVGVSEDGRVYFWVKDGASRRIVLSISVADFDAAAAFVQRARTALTAASEALADPINEKDGL